MEAFCGEIIAEIKTAKSEKEVIKVISSSMSQLRMKRNSFNESGFILNMIAALSANHRTGANSNETTENVKLAIEIFGQFQKERRGRIF
jgi:hypothetical protein